jgi:toxin ParE1/3/4
MAKIGLSRKAILHSLPAFLEIKYDTIKPGLLGHKVGHHILLYKKHDDGSIWIDRILHERMDYQRHL